MRQRVISQLFLVPLVSSVITTSALALTCDELVSQCSAAGISLEGYSSQRPALIATRDQERSKFSSKYGAKCLASLERGKTKGCKSASLKKAKSALKKVLAAVNRLKSLDANIASATSAQGAICGEAASCPGSTGSIVPGTIVPPVVPDTAAGSLYQPSAFIPVPEYHTASLGFPSNEIVGVWMRGWTSGGSFNQTVIREDSTYRWVYFNSTALQVLYWFGNNGRYRAQFCAASSLLNSAATICTNEYGAYSFASDVLTLTPDFAIQATMTSAPTDFPPMTVVQPAPLRRVGVINAVVKPVSAYSSSNPTTVNGSLGLVLDCPPYPLFNCGEDSMNKPINSDDPDKQVGGVYLLQKLR